MQLNKKALFRLDSGAQFGLGHVMRSKSLADALLSLQIECTFACRYLHSAAAISGHQLMMIADEDEFLALAKAYDVIIIDHYDYYSELFFSLSQLENTVLVILDDECNRGQLYADVIINPSLHASALDYKHMAADACLLLGLEYSLLRAIFTRESPLAFEQRESIVITLGGSDVTALTLPLLNAMLNINSILMSYKVVVVTGKGCAEQQKIAEFCQQRGLCHYHDVKNMAVLFCSAIFAISAAGSTAFELAYCGVPAVFAVVADNQLLSMRKLSQADWCEMVDCRKQNQPELILTKAQAMLSDLPQLERASQKARTLIDGQGAERIALLLSKKITAAQ
ncbi:UDP-2,4-diacetamido-2,4,6-trideoxy-beta-L-altropyranose hydrolase [sulfur-oxidizing endosymbiont of Gigantopelta aegis]|uniref:UDP-2,4-diacetamido-2,4, 6-trideoxy-beta-L-altropyranose hydrolase n=1 Tax=sulfur-oxidizing endosymbiont of Gigantopelta aegis TaxID=2794934 RepID=UPI001BE427E8|nr:UDP-2,4-diacetamido-2,4,6-trideoxy-beta-L-altropyranose hydrolase [sulfur-oxidizing endosymbiont of Gigantopelta aegis]